MGEKRERREKRVEIVILYFTLRLLIHLEKLFEAGDKFIEGGREIFLRPILTLIQPTRPPSATITA